MPEPKLTTFKGQQVWEMRTKVNGVTHNCPHTHLPRQQIIRDYIRNGAILVPHHEPDNPHSNTAVGLWYQEGDQWYHVGYLSDERAAPLLPLLKDHQPVKIHVTRVTGGTKNKPTRGLTLLITWPDYQRKGCLKRLLGR